MLSVVPDKCVACLRESCKNVRFLRHDSGSVDITLVRNSGLNRDSLLDL